jgi:hypothetical protein
VYILETIHVVGLAIALPFSLLGHRGYSDDSNFGVGFLLGLSERGYDDDPNPNFGIGIWGSPELLVHSLLVFIIGAIGGLLVSCCAPPPLPFSQSHLQCPL